MDNFDFLKSKNKDLYKIVTEAENLFRDEYFEQSIVQVRKFAENLCTDLLGDKVSDCDTFDLIINKIKDNMGSNIRLGEFVEDLYFIKKNGNASAHDKNSSKSGELALECLERAFEISIFYMNEKFGYSKKIDSLMYSEEVLMSGRAKKPQKSLKQQYLEKLDNVRSEKPAKEPKSDKKPKRQKSKPSCDGRPKTLLVFFVATVLTLILCLASYIALLILKR